MAGTKITDAFGPGLLRRFPHRVEYRDAEHRLAALSRCDAGDDVRAVFQHLPGMEGSLPASNALNDQACVLVD